MIFGKTHAEKHAEKQKNLEYLSKNPVCRFAWWPIELQNGKNIWLQKYWVNYQIRKTAFGYHMEKNFGVNEVKTYATEQEARDAIY